jgi:hypothetical protein
MWHQFTYSLLVPEGCGNQHAQILRYWKCSVTISYTTVRDTSGHCSYTSLIVKCRFSRMMWFTFFLQCLCDDRGSPRSLSVMNICSPIPKHCPPFSYTGRVHNMFAIDCNKSSVNFTGSNVFLLQKPNNVSHLTVGKISSFSSSSSRAFPVANAPDVLQPCGLLYCP